MQRAYREFQQRIEQLKATMLRGLLPVFQTLFERLGKLAEYLKEHPNLLKAIGVAATIAFGTLSAIIAPWTTAIAGIAAILALIIDDWVAFKEGGESAIGVVVDKCKQLWEWLKNIGSSISSLWNKVTGWFGGDDEAVKAGQSYVSTADITPLNGMTSNQMTMMNNNSSSQSSVWNVGSVTVNQKNNETAQQTMIDWTTQFSTAQP